MGLKYFDISKDEKYNKSLYRKWSKKLHPDMATGNAEKFAEMKAEYTKVELHFKKSFALTQEQLNNFNKKKTTKGKSVFEDILTDIIDKAIVKTENEIKVDLNKISPENIVGTIFKKVFTKP